MIIVPSFAMNPEPLLRHTGEPPALPTAADVSEEGCRLLAEHTDDFIFLNDADGHRLYVSPSYCRVTGWTLAEIRSTDWHLRLHPDDLPMIERTRAANLAGETTTIEHRVRCRDGRWLWVEARCKPLVGPDGRVHRLLLWSRDITAHRQAEAIVTCQTKVLEMIARGAPLAEALTILLQSIEAFAPGMLCSVVLLDEDGVHVRHGAAPSLPDAFNRAVDGQPIGPRAGSCGTAAFRREPVFVEDIATDPLWADYRELALAHGLRACWSTPIFDAQQRVLGTFAIYYREPGQPSALHRRCIELATGLAAIAISRHRTEVMLRAKSEELDRYFTNSLDLLCIADTDGFFRRLNPEWERTLGYPLAELEGRRFLDFIHPDDMDATLAALHKLSSREHVLNFVNRYRHQDGSYRWIEWRSYSENKVIFAVARDITERKRAEAALRESEERFASAFHTSPAAITITRVADGKFIDVNQAFLDLFEFNRGEVIGHTSTELNIISVEERGRVIQAQLESGGLRDAEFMARSKSGRPVHILFSSKPMELAGEMHHVTTMIDITARKQAEEALRASESRYRLLVETSPYCIHEIDRQGRLISMNRAGLEMMCVQEERAICGTLYLDAVAERDRERISRLLDLALQGQASEFEFVAVNNLHFQSSFVPIRDEHGAVQRLMGLTRDITARKLAEEKVREQLDELLRWQTVTLGREGRMLELKKEVNQLLAAQGQPARYTNPAS